MVASGTLQEVGSFAPGSQTPRELLRSLMAAGSSSIEAFLTRLQEGEFDTNKPRTKVCCSLPACVCVCVCVCAWVCVCLGECVCA